MPEDLREKLIKRLVNIDARFIKACPELSPLADEMAPPDLLLIKSKETIKKRLLPDIDDSNRVILLSPSIKNLKVSY